MAYAAVISFKRYTRHLISESIFIDPCNLVYDNLKLLKADLERLDIKSNGSFDTDAIKALDAELRKAVWKLEDVLQCYSFYRSRPPSDNNGSAQMQMPMDRYGVEQEVNAFLEKVELWRRDFGTVLHHPLVRENEDEDDVSPIPADSGGNKLQTVGLLEDQFAKVKKELVDSNPRRMKTVLLVGMAGIGKTHFAREIYQHPDIVKCFDIKAWVRVGRKRGVRSVLADIVAQLDGKPRSKARGLFRIDVLRMLLRMQLEGRTQCLIVLDDIWSEQLCDDIIGMLGEAGVSRVLLTTRLHHLHKTEQCVIHQMLFLDYEQSWSLLWQNVFAEEKSFPPQLEKVGRKIAANCEGLPLLILAVAHLLRGADKTEEYWNRVANKKTSTFDDAYEMISKVLISSYEHLPEHLKVCFLYMGVFPQSSEVPRSKLIDLFIVEDLLDPNDSSEDLRDFGAECVKKLVSHSLVLICEQSYNATIKSSKLHSAYWYVCVKEARKNQFFQVLNKLTDGAREYIEGQRRLSVQNNILFGINEARESMLAASTARSLLCTGKYHEYPVPICLNLPLLRVLDALSIRLYEFPLEVVKLLLLRYLALTHNGKLPSSISNLRHLQFLIIGKHHKIKLLRDSDSTYLPEEIWDMPQLKHLWIMGHNLPDPRDGVELPKLDKLNVNARSCTEGVFRSLPNLMKLGIAIELQPDDDSTSCCFEHIGLLRKLESLKCVVVNPWLRSQFHEVVYSSHISNLPRDLKKVSFTGLGHSWVYIKYMSWLPYLKVLKLRCSAFQGPKWKACCFTSLEFLLLEDIDLVDWETSSYFYGFERLQRLSLRHCFKLKSILSTVEHCSNLKTVEVVDCSPSVVAWANRIQEKRKGSVEVVINSSWSL